MLRIFFPLLMFFPYLSSSISEYVIHDGNTKHIVNADNRYRTHTNQDYIKNPDFAREDAEFYEQMNDIDNAIICYKKYSVLSGKDMSRQISSLENRMYPDWYNSSLMKAIPLSDGRVLIIYKELMQKVAWRDNLNANIVLPDILGEWDSCASQEVYNKIRDNGLYIPSDGLFSGCMVSGVDLGMTIKITNKKTGRLVKTCFVPNESKSLSINLMTGSGETEIDGGRYSRKGKIYECDVQVTTSDSRNYINVAYYPFRIIKKTNGIWNIEKTSKSLHGDATITKTGNVEIHK